MIPLIIYTSIAIIAVFLFSSLKKSISKRIPKELDGKYHLKLSSFYLFFGIICILAFFTHGIDQNDFDSFEALTIFSLGVYFLVDFKNRKVIFDQNEIHVTSWNAQKKSIKWEEITRIEYISAFSSLKIETNYISIKIPLHLVGIIHFIEHIDNHTIWNSLDLKIPPINKVVE